MAARATILARLSRECRRCAAPAISLALAVLVSALSPSDAGASLLFSTPSSSSDSDGTVGATAHFQILQNGQLTVTLTNTVPDITAIGQAISEFYFTWNGPGSITALSNISSSSVVVNDNGSVSTPSSVNGPGSDYHWGFGVNGGAVAIETVAGSANVAPGGQPNYLIVGPTGSDGTYGSGWHSIYKHSPSLYVSANFVFSDSALTTGMQLVGGDVSKVSFGFGTGPEATIGGNPTSTNSPEPTSLTLWSLMGLAGVVYARRKKRAAS